MGPVGKGRRKEGEGGRREANSKENAKSIQNRGPQGEGGRKGKGGGERQTVKKTQNQYRIGRRKGKEKEREVRRREANNKENAKSIQNEGSVHRAYRDIPHK